MKSYIYAFFINKETKQLNITDATNKACAEMMNSKKFIYLGVAEEHGDNGREHDLQQVYFKAFTTQKYFRYAYPIRTIKKDETIPEFAKRLELPFIA